jgi:hypothetical protein
LYKEGRKEERKGQDNFGRGMLIVTYLKLLEKEEGRRRKKEEWRMENGEWRTDNREQRRERENEERSKLWKQAQGDILWYSTEPSLRSLLPPLSISLRMVFSHLQF